MKSCHLFLSVPLAIILAGCQPTSSRDEFDRRSEGATRHSLFAEPTIADRPDARAVQQASQRHITGIGNKAAAAETKDWPVLFGPNRDSFIESTINPVWSDLGPKLVWQVDVGTGYGSPVAAGGKVIFSDRLDDFERVHCYRIDDGKLLWQHRYAATAVCNFEYSDGPYSTPIIDVANQRVFQVGGSGQMMCLDFDTGAVVWQRDLHSDYGVAADIFPVGASPVLDDKCGIPGGQLMFNLGGVDQNASVIALEGRSGETRWQCLDHAPSYASPFVTRIDGQRYAFVLTGEGLASIDPDQGTADWHIPFRRRGDLTRNATSPMVVDNHVIACASGVGGLCVDVLPDRSFKQRWRQRRTLDSQYNTVISYDDHLFSFTSSGQGGAELRCVSVDTGEIVWRYPSVLRRGMGFATPLGMILLGERGHLAALETSTKSPNVISFTTEPLMTSPCYCSPAPHRGFLVLKDEQRVAVFDLR
ncbi:MAG: PQQ-binding-like beta-propeller repeat protein [Planctomycetota bacterium]